MSLCLCPYRAEHVWNMILRPQLWSQRVVNTLPVLRPHIMLPVCLAPLSLPWDRPTSPRKAHSAPPKELGIRAHHCLEPLERRNVLDLTKIACAQSHVCCCPVYGKPEAYGMWRPHSEVFKNVWAVWHQGNIWWNHSSLRTLLRTMPWVP